MLTADQGALTSVLIVYLSRPPLMEAGEFINTPFYISTSTFSLLLSISTTITNFNIQI